MPTLPNMGLITPVLGADSGTWDDKINAAFALIDAHDHTSGKGVAVPVAGLNINANLPMGGFNMTGIGTLDFTAIAAPTSGSKRIFVNSADNELYWRSNAGTNVKITSGTTLNFTLVGGIVGDYSAVGAEVAYDDANDRYTFKQQGTKPWARLASGPVRIFEFNTTESVYVELAVAAALGASYTVTFPAAAAGSQLPMQIDASGNISFSNVFVNSPRYTTAEVYGINPATYLITGGGSPASSFDNSGDIQFGTSTLNIIIVPVNMKAGERITAFAVNIFKASDNTETITCKLRKRQVTGGTTDISTATNAGNAPGAITIGNTGLTETYDTAYKYWVEITHADSTPSGTDVASWTTITHDRPV